VLDIGSCGLRTIELVAFNVLTKLIELSIEGNDLSEIIPGTFENMNSLQYLGFYGNR
jgi:Leucine-rich repeat (LRR) protein